MDIRELRLGNFVSLHEGHVEFPLTRIRFERVISGYYEVEPIELTAEWMEEFGFEDCGNGNFYFDGFIWDSRDRILNIKSNWMDDYCYSLNVEYVHTLQNLYFALKGKELERKTV